MASLLKIWDTHFLTGDKKEGRQQRWQLVFNTILLLKKSCNDVYGNKKKSIQPHYSKAEAKVPLAPEPLIKLSPSPLPLAHHDRPLCAAVQPLTEARAFCQL